MIKYLRLRIGLITLIFFSISQLSFGQNTSILTGQDTSRRVITTAVPFLTIAPDARAGGMGDIGAATSADAAAAHWNPAKYAFIENDYGFSLSYTPWLGNIYTAYRQRDIGHPVQFLNQSRQVLFQA